MNLFQEDTVACGCFAIGGVVLLIILAAVGFTLSDYSWGPWVFWGIVGLLILAWNLFTGSRS